MGGITLMRALACDREAKKMRRRKPDIWVVLVVLICLGVFVSTNAQGPKESAPAVLPVNASGDAKPVG